MNTALDAGLMTVPAVILPGGLPIALTIALAVTALVALGTAVVRLRRTSRLNALTGGFSAASAVGVVTLAALLAALLVGTTPTPAAAPTVSGSHGQYPTGTGTSGDHAEVLTGYQLPTLPLP